jgi:hypothetical protein
VGHTFTSDYSRRFRTDLPPDSLNCPCRFQDRSWLHLIYECPCYHHHRINYEIWGNRLLTDMEPSKLFHENALLFLLFLQQSHAAFLPESGQETPFDPR